MVLVVLWMVLVFLGVAMVALWMILVDPGVVPVVLWALVSMVLASKRI